VIGLTCVLNHVANCSSCNWKIWDSVSCELLDSKYRWCCLQGCSKLYEFMVSQNINSTLLTKFKSNIYLLNKRSQLIAVKYDIIVCLSELYFRQISSPHDIFRCGSSRIGEYWQVPTWRHFTTIIMLWNTVDLRSQMRFEIVWDKCWDLLNNIGLTYWCLNIRLVLNLFFKIEQVPTYIELIKNYQLKKLRNV